MASLSPNLYKELKNTLQNCGPFGNHNQLRQVFVDHRLQPWRHTIPHATSTFDLVEAVIDHLVDQYSSSKENALVILLLVLAERVHQGNRCKQELYYFAKRLSGEIKSQMLLEEHVPKFMTPQDTQKEQAHINISGVKIVGNNNTIGSFNTSVHGKDTD